MNPQPIDTMRRRLSQRAGNGSRRRRFSLDGPKSRYYQQTRQERFAAHMRAA